MERKIQKAEDSLVPIQVVASKDNVYPSGLLGLDYGVLGIGGFPGGRLVEIAGTASSGKTTLCLMVLGECIKNGGRGIFIDAENTIDQFSTEYMAKFVSKSDMLDVYRPETVEQSFSIMEGAVLKAKEKGKNLPLVVVYDSLVGLPSQLELERGYQDTQVMASLASSFSRCFRKFTPFLGRNNFCCIFTNQLRENPGERFGNPEYTPGGKAMEYYSSLRVWLRTIKDDGLGKSDNEDRFKIRGRLIKTKVALIPLGSTFEEYFVVKEGIFDKVIDLVFYGLKTNLIVQEGSWYKIEGFDKKFQGFESMIKFFRNEEHRDKLRMLMK